MIFFDKILSHLFKKYTYKIYKKGYADGYNWHGCTKAVQEIKQKIKSSQ